MAESLALNGSYIPSPDYPAGPYALRPPGLPIVISIPMLLFGPSVWIGPALNLAIYVAICFVGYKIAEELVGEAWAALAVGLIAFFPANIAYGPLTLTEPLTMLLLLSGFWAILNNDHLLPAFLVGFFFGFAALTRPTFLVLGAILFAFFLFQAMGRKGGGKYFLISLVVFVLTLTPWALRNYLSFGELIPGSNLGGGGLLHGE